MATWLIDSGTLTNIADAIRAKTGSSAPIQVSDLAQEITNLPSGGTTIIGSSEIDITAQNDFVEGERINIDLGIVDTAPTGPGAIIRSAAINSAGTVLALALNNSPYLAIYDLTTNPYTKLTNPATAPTAVCLGIDFSPDGTRLAVVQNASPYIIIYDTTTIPYTKISDPGTLPPSNGLCCKWNNDGTILAVGHYLSPFITLYDTTTTPYTKISNPSELPAGPVYSIDYNSDGSRMATMRNDTNHALKIYNTTSIPYTKVSDVNMSGSGRVVRYLSDTRILTTQAYSPMIRLFDCTTDTLTEISGATKQYPIGEIYGIALNNDESKIYVSYTNSLNGSLYKYENDSITHVMQTETVQYDGTRFFNNKLIVSTTSSPYLKVLDLTKNRAYKYTNYNRRYGYAYAKENLLNGEDGKAMLLF